MLSLRHFIDPDVRPGDVGFRLRKLVVEDLDEDGVNSLQDCDDSDSTVPNNGVMVL